MEGHYPGDSGSRGRSKSDGHFATELLQELHQTSRASETFQPPSGHNGVEVRPTYRASLAKHGYLIRQTVGAGTYSKVKYGFYVSSQGIKYQHVAVKIVDRLKAPKDYLQKFLPRELELWPRISHSHIVRLYKWFEEYDKVFMITEWIEGGDLLSHVQKQGAIDEPQARIWFLQIMDAVRYLHSHGITHRDLKLENILIHKNGNLKICDFGFVRTVVGDQLSKTYCGSKSYAPPEILMGKPHDPMKVDIWALGVVLYIMITGKMPFDESKGNKAIVEAQKTMRLYYSRRQKPVTEECKSLIVGCMVFDYRVRPIIDELMQSDWIVGDMDKMLENLHRNTRKLRPTVTRSVST